MVSKNKNDSWETIHVISHPTRAKIIKLLNKGKMHISALDKELEESWTTIAHHLGILERFGILKSYYEALPNPGKFGHFYEVNREKLDEIEEQIKDGIKELNSD